MKNPQYKILAVILLIIALILCYIFPFTQSQIYNSVNLYFDNLQDHKYESVSLQTLRKQYEIDKKLMDDIVTKHRDNYTFTNRNIVITENTLDTATVTASVVIKAQIGEQIQTLPTKYQITMIKTTNKNGKKVWTVSERKVIN